MVAFVFGGVFAGHRISDYLKTRLIYPRTGFVEYRDDQRELGGWRVMAVILDVVVAALTVNLARLIGSKDWITAVTGLMVAMILIIIQGRTAMLQFFFYLLGSNSLVVGTALSLSGAPDGYLLGLFYGLLSLAFVTSGGMVLRPYLQ